MISMMNPEAVVAVTHGIMQVQASGLTEDQRRQIAEYLTGRKVGETETFPSPRCHGAAARFDRGSPPTTLGWGFDSRDTHFIPAAAAGLTAATAPKLKLRWAFAFPGANRARSQPVALGGAVIVGSQSGRVFALDRLTGCVRWSFAALGEVRTGIVASPWTVRDHASKPRVAFGDVRGNVYVVDAVSGALVWRDRPDSFPSATLTGTPTLSRGVLYVPISSNEESASSAAAYPCCRFRGSLVAYDFATGKRLWRSFMVAPSDTLRGPTGAEVFGPSGVAIWSSPVVDEARAQVYVATGNNYSPPATSLSDAVVALDRRDGHVKWVYQSIKDYAWSGGCSRRPTACVDLDFGASVILVRAGGRDVVLAGAKSGTVFAIDPVDGRMIWTRSLGRGDAQGGVHFGLATDGRRLYVPISDMPRDDLEEFVGHPGFYALDVLTGKTLWSAPGLLGTCNGRDLCLPGISAAITASPGLVYAGAMDGVLRIYDAASGKVLWSFDTAQPVVTVSGATAFGGAMGGGAAPLVVDGMVFASSGYGANYRNMPGRLLLAFDAR
jgi:polyvinyl alcohol dehydrogenase (cytochrome)